ncbi:MAG TPA: SgcJ/EcaC family oxidoreductase [Terracidiphilus sp.]|nr:SgcJ/EcaC family oxidoreductase [Terracidiphilus sp.]
MVARDPEHAVELLDQAFNAGDVEAVLNLYEDSAVVVTEPGKMARGKEELKRFFQRVAGAGSSARQLKTRVIEADGVALFLSRWQFNSAHEDAARILIATTVFRRQADGGWRAIIDNSFGPLILDAE